MATKFITNAPGAKSLSARVSGLTKSSAKLDFLVGYFFFSGFCEIYKEIKDKPMRILVGMDAEVDLANCIREYTSGRLCPHQLLRQRRKYSRRFKALNLGFR